MSYEYDGGLATTRHHEFLLAFRVRMATLGSSRKSIMQTISTECLKKAKLEGFAHITGSFTSPESHQQSQQSRSKRRFTRWTEEMHCHGKPYLSDFKTFYDNRRNTGIKLPLNQFCLLAKHCRLALSSLHFNLKVNFYWARSHRQHCAIPPDIRYHFNFKIGLTKHFRCIFYCLSIFLFYL